MKKLLCAAIAALLPACSEPSAVKLKVRITGDERRTPLRNPGTATSPSSDVDVLRLDAYNPTAGTTRQSEVTNDFTISDQIPLGSLDVAPGTDWRAVLTGVDRFGKLFSMGRSTPFEVPQSGSVEVPIVFGIADDFTTSAKLTGGLGAFPTATALADGSVLLVGATGAKLHRPVTGAVCADCLGGAPPSPRSMHVALRLPDGRVLVAGGVDRQGAFLADAYLFDAASAQFTKLTLTGLPGRAGSAAAVLGNGLVLIAGGRAASVADESRVVLVDVTAGTVSDAPALSSPVFLAGATALPSGEVLVAGGLDGSSVPTANAALYSSDGSKVQGLPKLLAARGAHSQTLLADGYVLLFGGRVASGASIAAPEVFAPSNKFLAVDTAATLEPRAGHAAVLLDTDAVLLMGGQDDPAGAPDPARLVPALRFAPVGEASGKYVGTFVPIGQLVARSAASAVILPDLSVLLAGGGRPALAVDPSSPVAAADWVEPLEVFVPCAIKGRACPE